MKERLRKQLACLQRVASSILATAAILVTAGCAATDQQENSAMPPHEGRDAIVDHVVNSTEQLDMDGWQASNGIASPRVCTMENGEEGAQYVFMLSTPQGSALEDDVQQMSEYWDSLGMDTRIVSEDVVSPRVYATGGPVLRASFSTNAPGETYRIGAVAPCVPGDATALIREANEQREDGERFPGDEYVPEENVDEVYKN